MLAEGTAITLFEHMSRGRIPQACRHSHVEAHNATHLAIPRSSINHDLDTSTTLCDRQVRVLRCVVADQPAARPTKQ